MAEPAVSGLEEGGAGKIGGVESDVPSTDGRRVRLRRARIEDAELLELWQSSQFTGEFNDFGPGRRDVRKAIEENGLSSDQGGTLMVELIATSKPIGTVSWHVVRHGPNPESAAWNIGINLIPEARGHGYGGETQRLLADHLMAVTPVNRIEAETDVDNTREQRALAKAGFHREGVLRGAQYRAGAWHDLVIYAIIRGNNLT